MAISWCGISYAIISWCGISYAIIACNMGLHLTHKYAETNEVYVFSIMIWESYACYIMTFQYDVHILSSVATDVKMFPAYSNTQVYGIFSTIKHLNRCCKITFTPYLILVANRKYQNAHPSLKPCFVAIVSSAWFEVTDLPIFLMATWLALWQYYDCPSVVKVTPRDMGKLDGYLTTRQNKMQIVCMILDILYYANYILSILRWWKPW